MSKLSIRFVTALLTFLLGVTASTVWLVNRQQIQLIIPDEHRDAIFFRSIDKRTTEANLPKLRTVRLPSGDLEVRVWVGFGVLGEDGLILRRSGDQWSALHLHGMAEREPFPNTQEILAAPKSGWEPAWQRLENAGLLTLPDLTAIPCSSIGVDGTGYIVEINKDKVYRTYMYHDPELAKCGESRQMVKIGEIIADEFGLKEFSVKPGMRDLRGGNSAPLWSDVKIHSKRPLSDQP